MTVWDDNQRAALLALLRVRPNKMRWDEIAEAVAQTNDACDLLRTLAGQTLYGQDPLEDAYRVAQADVRSWLAGPYRFLTFLDEEYPARLRAVHQVPPVLFAQGRLDPADRAVSVVGSRKASAEALKFAGETATLLVERGISVIAGLAEGVDTASHQAALDAGGRTVAVVGCGLNRYYPASNRDLQDQIAARGLVLSQFMPDFMPTRWSFPMRNATMSAYGYATIIVEASEHSGTRTQAREAVGHGRPVILTEAVVRCTRWGARLVNQPGVYVASSASEAVERVATVLDVESCVAELLARTSV